MVVHNEAYTTPAVGDNLLENFNVRISNRWREILKIGFVGGSAIADGEIEVFVGSTKVANIFNNDIGDTVQALMMWSSGGIKVPKGTPLSVMVKTIAAANYTLYLDIKDMK